jgi:lipoprotein-anchoring transpeptidase ErfK/SrfK
VRAQSLPRIVKPVATLALLALAGAGLAACSTGSSGNPAPTVTVTHDATVPATQPGTSGGTTPSTSTTAAGPTRPVHIKTLNSDGQTYGVGMPIIAYFSKKITDASTLVADTKVTADGQPVEGGWYFETSAAIKGYPIEGHWRPKTYWPAHSQVHVDLPMKGQSAGNGLAYDDNLTLDFAIGAAHILTVNNATHHLTVVSDGKKWGTFPISLGARDTPTLEGTKVIMERLTSVCMSGNPPNGPAYHECGVKWDQRLTYGGEYLHAAPWNCTGAPGCVGPANNIGHGNSSNGCTNLRPNDAERLYHYLNIGDVVRFPHTDGPRMRLGDGYGDWNLSWAQWSTGGLISTT